MNCAIALTARMMPYYFDAPNHAIDFIEALIDGLPDVSFCDRIANGNRKEVSSEVCRAVVIACAGNGHQHDPEQSKEKLDKTFAAWQRKGFSLVDRSTWGYVNRAREFVIPPPISCSATFSWTDDELHALTYFAKILKVDVQTTADATRTLLSSLANHPTGEMTLKYVRNHLESYGIKCGHHGKVNDYIAALVQVGWISQIGSFVKGRGAGYGA